MSAFRVFRIHAADRAQWLGTFPRLPDAIDAALLASRRGAEPVEVRADGDEVRILARYVAGVRVFYEGTVRA